MFEVSEKASEMIKDYLKDKEENLAIRVLMNEGG
jgi:Fe-S cluster assembly iron-binding protein IscA